MDQTSEHPSTRLCMKTAVLSPRYLGIASKFMFDWM
jgi:hypothetical protein